MPSAFDYFDSAIQNVRFQSPIRYGQMNAFGCPGSPAGGNETELLGKKLFVTQEDIRNLKRELAGIEIRAVAQNDDRQLVAGETVNYCPESHGAA